MKPDAIYLLFITKQPLKDLESVAALMQNFDDTGDFAPTHWGFDERARTPYKRDDFVKAVIESKGEYQTPCFQRKKAPKYKAFFTAKNDDLKFLKLTLNNSIRKKDVEIVFELGNLIAQRLKPELGLIHPVWRLGEESNSYNDSVGVKLADLQKYGLKAVCARTWFGQHITELVGQDLLDESGAEISSTSWNGIQLDFMSEPWKADFEKLSEKKSEIMSILHKSQVFCEYQVPAFRSTPAKKWVAIPS